MKLNKYIWASLATFALALVVLTVVSAAPQQPDQGQVVSGERTHFQPAKLFDFANYKALFKKSYSGVVENMMRFKWFTSRAMRSFISAVKYRFRESKFYLAINHMSDRSQAEMDMMRNKKLVEEYASASAGAPPKAPEQLPEFIPEDDDNAVELLRRAINERKGEPGFEELNEQLDQVEAVRDLAKAHRRKRDASSESAGAELPLRELPMANLINTPVANDNSLMSAETRAKIRERPTSNNPFYEGIEPLTYGLRSQQVPLETLELHADKPLASTLSAQISSLGHRYLMHLQGFAPKPDEVFVDLRDKSNCFFPARDQGLCASCYAFSAIAVAEYLHCKTTGELVPFSEQYVVDCGNEYSHQLGGCRGGSSSGANHFFHNFGWELRSNYPYVAREQPCPYPEDVDLRTTGYIRADLRKNIEFDIGMWPEALEKYGPLVVHINTGPMFGEYGSGVYDACEPRKPEHGVVLIGHGREDGEEYWLIRNSHSANWGEAGHMKLSKRADCVFPYTGWTFGSDDGLNLSLESSVNEANDGRYVESAMQ